MLELKNINLKYDNKTVFSDFGFKMNKGEKVLLRGESGKGKSTMLKLILGFAEVDSGNIYINNEELNKKTVWKFRKKLAYVSQGIELKEGRVDEIFREIFSYENNNEIFYQEKIENLIELFDLDKDTLEKNTEDLSGGEKQRIGIIIALVLDRDLYLLDEVSSALDMNLKKKVAEYFLKSDKTVLVVSHDREWLGDNVRVVEL